MKLFFKILIYYVVFKTTSLHASEQIKAIDPEFIKIINDSNFARRLLLREDVITIKDIKFVDIEISDTIIKNKIFNNVFF